MEDKEFLLGSQQGELDAVPMYLNLSKKFEKKNPQVAEILKEMAADEGKHAAVFRKLSGEVLKPKMLQAKAVPILMNLLGKKLVFKVIAKLEYNTYDSYGKWVEKYPDILNVQADEKKHGDLAMKIVELLKVKQK